MTYILVSHSNDEVHDYGKLLDNLDQEEDSEDDEPSISPENPFVCSERDKSMRQDPCVGIISKSNCLIWESYMI